MGTTVTYDRYPIVDVGVPRLEGDPPPGGTTVSEITTQDRFRGCLLGLAVGDALGTTLEFQSPGTFMSRP